MKNKKPSHLDMSRLEGENPQEIHAPIFRNIYRIAGVLCSRKAIKTYKNNAKPNNAVFILIVFISSILSLYW